MCLNSFQWCFDYLLGSLKITTTSCILSIYLFPLIIRWVLFLNRFAVGTRAHVPPWIAGRIPIVMIPIWHTHWECTERRLGNTNQEPACLRRFSNNLFCVNWVWREHTNDEHARQWARWRVWIISQHENKPNPKHEHQAPDTIKESPKYGAQTTAISWGQRCW